MSQYTPLDVDRIEDARRDACIGRKVVLYTSTASTNDIAWEYARNADNHGLCVLAESQSAGRGRRGRMWYSAPRQSILCSVLLTKTDAPAEMLTLTAGVATAEAIHESAFNHGQASGFASLRRDEKFDRATRSHCRIKWPNDILIQNRKIAGILTEKQTLNDTDVFVIGIGINCNQTAAAFEGYDLKIPATSLATETGHAVDRTELVCVLLDKLDHWIEKIGVGTAHPTEGVAAHPVENPVIERWLQLSGMLGRHITVECDGIRYSGFCRGVDPVEGLILQLDNSLVRMFAAAQTSIIES